MYERVQTGARTSKVVGTGSNIAVVITTIIAGLSHHDSSSAKWKQEWFEVHAVEGTDEKDSERTSYRSWLSYRVFYTDSVYLRSPSLGFTELVFFGWLSVGLKIIISSLRSSLSPTGGIARSLPENCKHPTESFQFAKNVDTPSWRAQCKNQCNTSLLMTASLKTYLVHGRVAGESSWERINNVKG